MELALRYDMRAPGIARPAQELYDAALDQCAWADEQGFTEVKIYEHHGAADGYCSSPLVMAAAIAARTRSIRIRATIILPLHDPVRIAEDAVAVDLISGGRLEILVVAGYIDDEYAMFGRRRADRVRLMERGVAALRSAWTGEPFEYDGRPCHVPLRSVQQPSVPLLMGGSSPVAARRAAKLADGFEPNVPFPDIIEAYVDERARLGGDSGRLLTPRPFLGVPFVAEDVDDAWRRIGPFLLHENNSYAAWLAAAGTPPTFVHQSDEASLRKHGPYHIMTPDALGQLADELGPDARFEFAPLAGGMNPNDGWENLRHAADVAARYQNRAVAATV